MSALIVILAVVIGLVVLDIISEAYGVDSRRESRDPRSPAGGIS